MAKSKQLCAAISDEELFSPDYPTAGTELRLADDGSIVRREFGPKILRQFSDSQLAGILKMAFGSMNDYSIQSLS